ncbi:MAG: NAD(P)-binding domain-containing protein [Chloroflexota bacterium]
MSEGGLPKSVQTVVVGGGQAGLAISSLLRQAGREHVVLDRRVRVGGGWQDRWDEFRLVSPNWGAALPGFAYDGPDPDAFMTRDEIVARIARYAEIIDAPVELGTAVLRLTGSDQPGGGFHLETDRGTVIAGQVIVATGGYHVPRIPAVSADLPERIVQLHSHAYRNETALPPGGVLVVGSGQSGVQIAEELHGRGRQVILAVGRCGRLPRRYRGRDIFEWLKQVVTRGADYGLSLPTVATLPDPRLRFAAVPHLSGHDGGHETNLRQFAADGIRLAGHVDAADGERVRCAPGLSSSLAFADAFFGERLQPVIDTFIAQAGIDAPPDDREPFDFEPPEVLDLDLEAEGVSTVIWTSGYRLDFGWIDLPIFDEQGAPCHSRGISEVPGLSFLGLPWLHDQASATLYGVSRDAAYLADRW